MANIQITQRQRGRRTFIRIAATPKSPGTRTLLQQFKRGVSAFGKRWKAAAAAYKKKAARKSGGRRRSRRRR